MLKPKRRRVVSAKPSRTACQTCRIRRVKCDELKPNCRRCTSTGRKCDGYNSSASSPPKDGAANGTRKLLPSSAACRHPFPCLEPKVASLEILINDYEKSAYEWFIFTSANVLWHTSPAKEWILLALQLGMQEQTVFYAATAVASIHRAQPHYYHHTLIPTGLRDVHSGLDQYCKATASLQRYIDGAISNGFELEPVLVCCLLFVAFETFHGNGYRALAHLRWCKGLINGAQRHSSSMNPQQPLQPSRTLDELLMMFRKLEVELDVTPRTLHLPTDQRMHFTVPKIVPPACFASIQMAKDSLCIIMDASARFQGDLRRGGMKCITQDDSHLRDAVKWCIAHCLSRTIDIRHNKELRRREDELRRAHKVWMNALHTLKQKAAIARSPALILMEIQHYLSKRTFETCHNFQEFFSAQNSYDDAQALDLIEEYFVQTPNIPSATVPQANYHIVIAPEPQQSFSLEDGILPALYLICLKCRSSSTRRRALQMLRNADRREGLYYSRALADRAEDIIQLEENRAKAILEVNSLDGCTIPQAAMMSDVVVESTSPFETRVICGRFQHEGNGFLEIVEYRRFRKPLIDPEPIWRTVLGYRC